MAHLPLYPIVLTVLVVLLLAFCLYLGNTLAVLVSATICVYFDKGLALKYSILYICL
jgi:hypothetical protein